MRRRPFVILAVVYALARYQLALLVGSPIFGWRPTDLASIALGYLRNGFHFLYPQVFWGGNGPGYVEMEFPLMPFVTALLFKCFGVHEWFCIAVSEMVGLGIVWTVYEFGERIGGTRVGLIAAALAAMSPALVFMTSTGLWPDPPMVLFATLGLYFMVRWVDGDRRSHLALACVSISLAILFKLTALCVGIPVLYLFVRKYGGGWWKRREPWLFAAGTLVSPLLWYAHAYRLSEEYHNTFGILVHGSSKFATRALLTDAGFYLWVITKIAVYQVTPIGALGLVASAYAAIRARELPVLLAWLASVVFCALVAAGGVRAGHYQYLLPFLPVGCLLSGIGWAWLHDRLRDAMGPRSRAQLELAGAAVFAGLLVANGLWATRRFESRDRANDSISWEAKKTTGQALKGITTPQDLVIVVDDAMDDQTPETAMTPPDVFYFADRRGWYLSLAWLNKDRVLALQGSGAHYLVVSGQSVAAFKTRSAAIYGWLSSSFREISDGREGIFFDLTHPTHHGS